MNNNLIQVLPNASNLIESMRSIGYSFETAMADILDNSISANAENIDINLKFKPNSEDPTIQIIDDGHGMNENELIEAMRLGSKNPLENREEKDLGRFGLGLKSSSFSQCKVLTVVSKKHGILTGFEWDLDVVKKSNDFSLKKLSPEKISEFVKGTSLDNNENGTIIQWADFDRIKVSSNNIFHEISDLMNRTIEHISLIFHRYLDSGLKIFVNNEKITAKDPFLKNHPATQELQEKKVKIEGETVHLHPYVLPHYSKMSNKDKIKAGKTEERYKSQGLYIYRNQRLIVWGEYLGLSNKSEFGKNSRILVDIPNSLDYLWEIDVKKSRARVPSRIKKNLLSAIVDGERTSRKVNTHRGNKEITSSKSIWQIHEDREGDFYLEFNKKHRIYSEFIKTLDDDQLRLFSILSKTLEMNVPYNAIYTKIGSGNKEIKNENYEVVEELLLQIEHLKKIKGYDVIAYLNDVRDEEPYSSNEKAQEIIQKEIGEV